MTRDMGCVPYLHRCLWNRIKFFILLFIFYFSKTQAAKFSYRYSYIYISNKNSTYNDNAGKWAYPSFTQWMLQ